MSRICQGPWQEFWIFLPPMFLPAKGTAEDRRQPGEGRAGSPGRGGGGRAAGGRWLIPAQTSGKKMGGKNMPARPQTIGRALFVRLSRNDSVVVETSDPPQAGKPQDAQRESERTRARWGQRAPPFSGFVLIGKMPFY